MWNCRLGVPGEARANAPGSGALTACLTDSWSKRLSEKGSDPLRFAECG